MLKCGVCDISSSWTIVRVMLFFVCFFSTKQSVQSKMKQSVSSRLRYITENKDTLDFFIARPWGKNT